MAKTEASVAYTDYYYYTKLNSDAPGREMSEQYDIAAERHLLSGEFLEAQNRIEDAGYHFGVSGENSVKSALSASGVEAALITIGRSRGLSPSQALRNTPMRAHFPNLHTMISNSQALIAAHASGRLAANIATEVLSPNFRHRFKGWDIQIRYEDIRCCPVSPTSCAVWRNDATDFYLSLVL